MQTAFVIAPPGKHSGDASPGLGPQAGRDPAASLPAVARRGRSCRLLLAVSAAQSVPGDCGEGTQAGPWGQSAGLRP